MLNFIQNILYNIIKTRLHVAAIYYFLCINIIESTAHINASKFIPIIISFTIWHFALYLFDRAYDANLDYLNNPAESLKGNNRKYFLYFSIFLPIVPIGILYFFNQPILPYLFLLPVTYLYNLRIFSKNRAIKHFTVIKNLYSAVFIWPLPIAIILKYYVGIDNYLIEIMYWFWSFIAYVFMGEVIWDMRDVDGDSKDNIRTIPVVFGLNKTRIFLFSVLIFVSVINYIQNQNINYVLIIFYIIYITISSPKLPKWVFHFPLFVSLFYYIFEYN